MSAEEQFATLSKLIKTFKDKIILNPLSSQKSLIEYDTFKRFTTSRKDHGPQTRLVYNVRKPWPIVINKSNSIPCKFNGIHLKNSRVEIGTSDKVGANIVVPDYWMKFGSPTELSVADALIEHELEKVRRFFGADWGQVQFLHSFPYRKSVVVAPTIEDVSPQNVNNTLLQLFCPQFSTLETRAKANKVAIGKIKRKINPILDLKSFPSVVHIARGMITTHKKWLPVLVSHTPESAELSHFLCSRFHNIPIRVLPNSETPSIERLCGEIVKACLSANEPKIELVDTLKKVRIADRTLDEVLVDQEGDTPFIGICRVALGLTINYSKRIRDTRFIIMESEMPRVESSANWKLGLMDQAVKYMHFQGRFKVFFQWYNTKGYFVGTDREVEEIYINSEEETYLNPLILDICYYTACIEPGFEQNYGQFFRTNELFNQFFIYHHHDVLPVYTHFGIGESGVLSNSFHWKINSNGYIQKIKELLVPVQPYEQSFKEYMLNDHLEVYSVHPMGLSKMIEPSEAIIPYNAPLPVGLDATRTNLVDIIKNPLIKIKTLLKTLALNPERCEQFVFNAINEEVDPFVNTLNQVMPVNTSKKANRKRLLQTLEDEDWVDCPRKRLKAAFDAMVVCSSQSRKRKSKELPMNNIPFKIIRENFSYNLDKGMVTDTKTTLRVMGEIVDRGEFLNIENYVQTGVFDSKPEVELVVEVQDALDRDLKKFCVQSHGRYFVVEHKHSIWTESDNVKEALKRQREMSKTAKLEHSMKVFAGILSKSEHGK